MRKHASNNVLYKGLSIFFVLTLICSLSITAFAAEKTLGISRVQQEKDNWCWAACGEMIGTYVNSNSTEDQWSIVKEIKGTILNQYPDKGATDAEVEEAIEVGSANTVNYTYNNSVRSFANHQSDIDNGYPICVQMQWSSGKHVVVAAGYKTGTQNMLYLIDPWYDCGAAYYSYTALKNGTTIQSGTGSYINSYYYAG